MAKHRPKKKKFAKGKQFWAVDFCYVPEDYVPASHHREDRTGFCGRCGHPWDWHDNVWLKVDDKGKTIDKHIRCRGGYLGGLSVISCKCRDVYPR